MSRLPRILFLVDDGWRYEKKRAIRSLLARGYRVRLATTQAASAAALREEFEDVWLLPIHRLPAWREYPALFFARELDTALVRNRAREKYHRASPAKRVLIRVRSLLGALGLRRRTYSEVREKLYRGSRYYGEVLDGIDRVLFVPVAVIDQRLLHEARERGLPVLAWVYSWDNPMKDNDFFLYAHSYGVWNPENAADLWTYHRIPADRVRILGPVQFDALFARQAAPPGRVDPPRVLYICSVGRVHLVRQELELIRWVREQLDAVAPEVPLLVRPYPFRMAEATYDALEGLPGIQVAHFGNLLEGKVRVPEEEEELKLQQIEASSCIVNLGSTLGLEAAFTRTPILQFTALPPLGEAAPIHPLSDCFRNEHLAYIFRGDFPNLIRDAEMLRRAFHAILREDRRGDYMGYSGMLRAFADPLPDRRPYTERFLDWVGAPLGTGA